MFEQGTLSSNLYCNTAHHNCNCQTKKECKKRKGTQSTIWINIPSVRHQKK